MLISEGASLAMYRPEGHGMVSAWPGMRTQIGGCGVTGFVQLSEVIGGRVVGRRAIQGVHNLRAFPSSLNGLHSDCGGSEDEQEISEVVAEGGHGRTRRECGHQQQEHAACAVSAGIIFCGDGDARHVIADGESAGALPGVLDRSGYAVARTYRKDSSHGEDQFRVFDAQDVLHTSAVVGPVDVADASGNDGDGHRSSSCGGSE